MYNEIKIENKGTIKISVNVSNFTSQHRKTLSLLDIDEDMEELLLSLKPFEELSQLNTVDNCKDKLIIVTLAKPIS